MARLFDAYIMVDWSAAAKPVTGANSVWVGILAKDARLKFQFRAVNPDTRLKARAFIHDMVTKLIKRGDKVLLGFDFSFGFPAGTADAMAFGDDVAPWQAMFEYLSGKVREREDNSNARFAIAAGMNYAISKGPFPFWGAPAKDQVNTLGGKRPTFDDNKPLAEFRIAERHLKEAGLGQPKSCWQLAYQGSVGSQTLLGIPHIAWLTAQLPNAQVWPFQLPLADLEEEILEPIDVVIAEIYPSLIKAKPASGQILDEAQVEAIARHYCDLDGKDRLGALFSGAEHLNAAQKSQIACEEGWILGI
ncbi:MAG: hypothetical protein AAF829_00710 [Pseudomonadota bacterium]